jgi:predicted nucleic acid-binding protein
MAPFLDRNVALYAFIGNDPRRMAARALLESDFCISAQVLNEFANVARRKFGLQWSEIAEIADGFDQNASRVIALDSKLNRHAIILAEQYRLAFYDALIVAAALSAECETLYSEDMHDGLVIDSRLTIRNPFV